MSDWDDDEMERRRAWLDEGPWVRAAPTGSRRRGPSLGGVISMGNLGMAGGLARPRGASVDVELGAAHTGSETSIPFDLGLRRDPVAERLHRLAVRSGYLGGREVPWRITTVEGLGARLSVGTPEREPVSESRHESPGPGAALRYAGFLAGLAELHRDPTIAAWLQLLNKEGPATSGREQFADYLRGGRWSRGALLLEGCLRFVRVLANSLSQVEGDELAAYAAVHEDWLKRFLRDGPGDVSSSVSAARTWAETVLGSPRLASFGTEQAISRVWLEELREEISTLESAYCRSHDPEFDMSRWFSSLGIVEPKSGQEGTVSGGA